MRARAVRDARFRVALLAEGLDALLAGDLPGCRGGLRNHVNATLGFAGLAERSGLPEKSLMRMLGPRGNPRAEHLAALIAALADSEGVEATVRIRDPR